jgi:hypothetical protein
MGITPRVHPRALLDAHHSGRALAHQPACAATAGFRVLRLPAQLVQRDLAAALQLVVDALG